MAKILDHKPRRLIDFWKHNGQSVYCGTVQGTYVLDEVAGFIWERCDGQHSVARIIEELVAATKMEGRENIVQADVERLLTAWTAERLIIGNFDPLHAGGESDKDQLYTVEGLGKDADILLVVPPSPNPMTWMRKKAHSTFPLGIASLASVLKEHGYRVELANLWIRQMNTRSVAHLIEVLRPKVLGISTMTDNFQNGVTISRIARAVSPDIKIIFGGPHVTFTDKESMEANPEIDVVVRNEGEFSLLELMDYYIHGYGSLERIQGITIRNGSTVWRNDPRPLVQDLDELPLPIRAELAEDDALLGVQTSRGCAERCVFCVASSMSGGQVRYRSANNVLDELQHIFRRGVREVFFQDDTITSDVSRLQVVLEALELSELKLTWSAESRVDVIDKDPLIFDKMARAGCFAIQFGVEAGSQDVLDYLQKNIRIDQIHRAISAAKTAGLRATCTMLVGHPYDTSDTIRGSVSFAKQLIDEGADVLFSIVVPYPGTKLARAKSVYGHTIHPTHYNDYSVTNAIMDTSNMTNREIRAHYFDAMCEIMQYKEKVK